MRLIDAIPVDQKSRIAFVGAGGKTTAMFLLARQADGQGLPLILCAATTHLAEEQLALADNHYILSSSHDLLELDQVALNGVALLTGKLGKDGRTQGLPLDLITEVEKLALARGAALLIEADGAKRKPLKAPADHEPVIPAWVEQVVVVMGMSGVGLELSEEIVHRSEIFGALAGLKQGDTVGLDAVASVMLSERGGLKGIPPQAKRIALLNQCDTAEKAAQGKMLSATLKSSYGQVILSRLEKPSADEVIAVHRSVAGVILAAGGSVRMGQPKQLLQWQGKSFIQAVVQTVLDSGLYPVMVITGAFQDQVENELKGLPVEVVFNPEWAEGQSSSVRKAVESLSAEAVDVYGAVFFLVDQPQIPVALVQSLLEAYSVSLNPIVAPMVNDRRGNPVLFDQTAFAELRQLRGDAGGRQVFSRFRVQYVPWLDDHVGLDVDTFEDYQRLLSEGEG